MTRVRQRRSAGPRFRETRAVRSARDPTSCEGSGDLVTPLSPWSERCPNLACGRTDKSTIREPDRSRAAQPPSGAAALPAGAACGPHRIDTWD